MKNIAVLFGGQSVEHEVSIITGMQIIENMDKDKYRPIPVYIDKKGQWLGGDCLRDFKTFKEGDLSKAERVYFKAQAGDHKLYTKRQGQGGFFSKATEEEVVFAEVDFVFPALHGTYGEDGKVQGLLDILNIAYGGAATSSAALGMDKVLMKEIFIAKGLPVLDYTYYYRSDYEKDPKGVIKKIEDLGYPVFVKPANLGSSIGISKVKNREGLGEAMDLAQAYDRKIIVERAAKKPREINAAVLGFEGDLEVSACEEPLGWKEFLNYEDKYIHNGKAGKGSGAKTTSQNRRIPADLDKGLRKEIESLAKKAFKAIDGAGTARIDFLVEGDQVYINEINTLPGSLGFYLWEAKGLSFKDLISRVIEIGEMRAHQEANKLTHFDAKLLERTGYGSKL
ncbi:MAG: D-alanine--D-alanine ligase family protein [Tissierellia bacterium]|nr:D-alanine--D-alanine ligase family protein [Tissierellia bacterium]